MPTYNYIASNPAISNLIEGATYTVDFLTTNQGPATLQFNTLPVVPITKDITGTPLTGGELSGTFILIFKNGFFAVIGGLAIIPPGSITGNEVAGSTSINLITDPLFAQGSVYWDFSRSNTILIEPNLTPGGQNGLFIPGSGTPVGFQQVVSSYIAVTSGVNYNLSGFIDASNITGFDFPAWLVMSTDLATTYATAIPDLVVAGIVTTTFQFPPGVSEVVVVFITNNAVITSSVIASIPQLEFGTVRSSVKSNLSVLPIATGPPVLFGSWLFNNVNGVPLHLLPGSNLIPYGGATATEFWESTFAYSGTWADELDVANGGVSVGARLDNYGLTYTTAGSENYTLKVRILSSGTTPDQIAVALFIGATVGTAKWYGVYWGQDLLPLNVISSVGIGTVPTTVDAWVNLVFSGQQLGAPFNQQVFGLTFGTWIDSGTSNVIFSDFCSSVPSVVNLDHVGSGVNNAIPIGVTYATPGNHTYTVPLGVHTIMANIFGAGGGVVATGTPGTVGGGAGAGIQVMITNLMVGDQLAISVGTRGNSSNVSATNGTQSQITINPLPLSPAPPVNFAVFYAAGGGAVGDGPGTGAGGLTNSGGATNSGGLSDGAGGSYAFSQSGSDGSGVTGAQLGGKGPGGNGAFYTAGAITQAQNGAVILVPIS